MVVAAATTTTTTTMTTTTMIIIIMIMIIINLDLAGNNKGNLYFLHRLICFTLLVWPHDNNNKKPEILLHK